MKNIIAAVLTMVLVFAHAIAIALAAKPSQMTVAYFAEWPTANQVAQVERWYDKELGLEVNWQKFDSGVEMANAMVAGEVDISYSIGIIPFMAAVSAGAPLKAIGVAVSYAENDNCVVHHKAAIDKANAHELIGKKIAVPLGTVTHYKLLRTLEALAVDTTKLNLIDMVSSKGAEALLRGEVTMACGWGGALRRMLDKNRVLMTASEQTKIGIRTFDVIAVTNEFSQAYPNLVTKFLEVTDRATDYLYDHPDDAKALIAKGAGLGVKESNVILSKFQFYTRDAQLSSAWLRGGVQAFTKEVADFYVKQGAMPKALNDYRPVFDESFYQNAN